jgi:hypothetical protein
VKLHTVTLECQLISFYGCLGWFHILKEAMFLCLLYALDSILRALSYLVIRCIEKSWIDNEATYNTYNFCKITKTIFIVILIFNKRIGCRETKAYDQGVNSFLAFAFRNSATGNKILCPYRKCVNTFWREASEVREHLISDGFLIERGPYMEKLALLL